ncbi:unnamed protein product [Clavelina lepadiformis]|uniref:Uncharacterized protein n=1 Tax=Clavelina lepadiformis TaxID=159417 RepID=A0ABP0G7J3_CLALP
MFKQVTQQSLKCCGPKQWNNLLGSIRDHTSTTPFSNKLKAYLLERQSKNMYSDWQLVHVANTNRETLDRLLQDPTGHQICSSLPGTYITVDVCIFKQSSQTIWLDMSDVVDHLLLPLITDLCKRFLPCTQATWTRLRSHGWSSF